MNRELTLRVPSEIGAWVRQQPGSASETVLALAGDVYKRRQAVRVRDCGPGDDRLKIRLEPRAVRFIRAATHSRDATAAVRKLLCWGYGRTLPAAPSHPVLSGRVAASALVAPALLPRPSPAGENWEGVRIPAGSVPACPHPGMALVRSNLPSSFPVSAESPAFDVPAPVSRVIEAMPVPVLAIGIPVAFLVGGYFLLKWLVGLTAAAKLVAGTAGVAKAAAVAPTVAAWTPQAAAGLGAVLL